MYEKFNIDFKKYDINVNQILRANYAVPDPDLEMRGGGGGPVIQTLRKGGPGLEKKFFRHFGPHFGGKIRGDPGPPGPSPGSATVKSLIAGQGSISGQA